MFLHQVCNIIFFQQLIKDVIRPDNSYRPLGTKTIATGQYNRNLILKVVFLKLSFE